MTAVHPADGATMETNCEMRFTKTSSSFLNKRSRNEASGGLENIEVDKSCDEKHEPTTDILSPLLMSMRLCGQYFIWPFNEAKNTCKADAIDERSGVTKAGVDNRISHWQKASAIYGLLVTINLWINGARLMLVFTPNDHTLPALIMKIMTVTWNIQCAMQQTAYVAASVSGRLEKVLNDIQLNSVSSRTYFRRLTRWLTLATWLMTVADLAFMTYTTCFAGGLMDMVLVPIGTYVNVSQLAPFRIAFVIGTMHLHSAWWFPVTMTFLLSCIFAHQFRSIADRFRRILNDPENAVGTSEDEIEEIRLQHQLLCRTVNRADRFLKFYHLAAFFGPLTVVISMLYVMFLYPSLLSHNPVATAIFSFWLFTFISQLSLIIGGGIIVNHYVRIF
jgi:hypothetical protein